MINEQQVDELIDSMLKRPEMWASNAESLAFQVLTLLYVKTGKPVHTEFFKCGQNYFDLDGSAIPFYHRVNLSVPEMAGMLIYFVRQYGN